MIELKFAGRKKLDMNMDVAPMVDIIFLLLLFFLLTSQFVKMSGISVELPGATTSEHTSDSEIIVTVTSDRGVFINGDPVAESLLGERLCETIKQSGKGIVRIDADRDAQVAPIIRVMDHSRNCGAKSVDISTIFETGDTAVK